MECSRSALSNMAATSRYMCFRALETCTYNRETGLLVAFIGEHNSGTLAACDGAIYNVSSQGLSISQVPRAIILFPLS